MQMERLENFFDKGKEILRKGTVGALIVGKSILGTEDATAQTTHTAPQEQSNMNAQTREANSETVTDMISGYEPATGGTQIDLKDLESKGFKFTVTKALIHLRKTGWSQY